MDRKWKLQEGQRKQKEESVLSNRIIQKCQILPKTQESKESTLTISGN